MVVLPISIHAPTRGATASSIQYLDLGSISIHAPTRGATRKQVRPLLEPRRFQSTLPRGERPQYRTIIHSIVYFNPRSHEGSDGNMLLQLLSTVISIHAPTRGATSAVLLLPVATSNFNPRSHEGSDQTSTQSILTILYFNPRSHEGSDLAD